MHVDVDGSGDNDSDALSGGGTSGGACGSALPSLAAALAAYPLLPEEAVAVLRDLSLPPPPEVLVWQVLLHGVPAVDSADGGGCRPTLRLLRLPHEAQQGTPGELLLHDSTDALAPGEQPRYVGRASEEVVHLNLSAPLAGDVLLRVGHAPGDLELASVAFHTGFLLPPVQLVVGEGAAGNDVAAAASAQQGLRASSSGARRAHSAHSSPALISASEVFHFDAGELDVAKRSRARLPPGFAIELFYDVRAAPTREARRVVQPLSEGELAALAGGPAADAGGASDRGTPAPSAVGSSGADPLAASLWAPAHSGGSGEPAITESDVLSHQYFHAGYAV